MRVGDVTVEVGIPGGTLPGSSAADKGGDDALKLALRALEKTRRRERLAEMALDGGGETSFGSGGSGSEDNLKGLGLSTASAAEDTEEEKGAAAALRQERGKDGASEASSTASTPPIRMRSVTSTPQTLPGRAKRRLSARQSSTRRPRPMSMAYSESGWNADSDSEDYFSGTPDLDSDWGLDEGEEEYIRSAAILSALRPEKAAIGPCDASGALAPRAEAGESAQQTLSRCLARVASLADIGVDLWVIAKPVVGAVWAALRDERGGGGDSGGDGGDAADAEKCVAATIARVVEAAAPRANAAQQRAVRDIAAAMLVLVLGGEVKK